MTLRKEHYIIMFLVAVILFLLPGHMRSYRAQLANNNQHEEWSHHDEERREPDHVGIPCHGICTIRTDHHAEGSVTVIPECLPGRDNGHWEEGEYEEDEHHWEQGDYHPEQEDMGMHEDHEILACGPINGVTCTTAGTLETCWEPSADGTPHITTYVCCGDPLSMQRYDTCPEYRDS